MAHPYLFHGGANGPRHHHQRAFLSVVARLARVAMCAAVPVRLAVCVAVPVYVAAYVRVRTMECLRLVRL